MARRRTYFRPPPIMPVKIRTDLTVHIQNLPWNLTQREADKLKRVIQAMVNEAPLPVSHRLPPPPTGA